MYMCIYVYMHVIIGMCLCMCMCMCMYMYTYMYMNQDAPFGHGMARAVGGRRFRSGACAHACMRACVQLSACDALHRRIGL